MFDHRVLEGLATRLQVRVKREVFSWSQSATTPLDAAEANTLICSCINTERIQMLLNTLSFTLRLIQQGDSVTFYFQRT